MEVYDMNKIKYALLLAMCSSGMANAFGFFDFNFGMPVPVVHTRYCLRPVDYCCPSPVRYVESVRSVDVEPVTEYRVVERESHSHDHHRHGRHGRHRGRHHFGPRPHVSFGFDRHHFEPRPDIRFGFGFNF